MLSLKFPGLIPGYLYILCFPALFRVGFDYILSPPFTGIILGYTGETQRSKVCTGEPINI